MNRKELSRRSFMKTLPFVLGGVTLAAYELFKLSKKDPISSDFLLLNMFSPRDNRVVLVDSRGNILRDLEGVGGQWSIDGEYFSYSKGNLYSGYQEVLANTKNAEEIPLPVSIKFTEKLAHTRLDGIENSGTLSHNHKKFASFSYDNIDIVDVTSLQRNRIINAADGYVPIMFVGKDVRYLLAEGISFVEWTANDDEIVFNRGDLIYRVKPDGSDLDLFMIPRLGLFNVISDKFWNAFDGKLSPKRSS